MSGIAEQVAGGLEKGSKTTQSPRREKLDVESPEDRQQRLGRLFTSPSLSTPKGKDEVISPLPTSRPDIGYIPQSDILARVRNFLPLLASSNETLLQQAKENPSAVDIENTAGEGQVIEMDLGLGVYDVKGQAKGDMGPELDIPEQGVDDEDDEDEDEDGDEDMEEDESEDSSDSDSSSEDNNPTIPTQSSTIQPGR